MFINVPKVSSWYIRCFLHRPVVKKKAGKKKEVISMQKKNS